LIDITTAIQYPESEKPKLVSRKTNRPNKELIQESEKPKLKSNISQLLSKNLSPSSFEKPV